MPRLSANRKIAKPNMTSRMLAAKAINRYFFNEQIYYLFFCQTPPADRHLKLHDGDIKWPGDGRAEIRCANVPEWRSPKDLRVVGNAFPGLGRLNKRRS